MYGAGDGGTDSGEGCTSGCGEGPGEGCCAKLREVNAARRPAEIITGLISEVILYSKPVERYSSGHRSKSGARTSSWRSSSFLYFWACTESSLVMINQFGTL